MALSQGLKNLSELPAVQLNDLVELTKKLVDQVFESAHIDIDHRVTTTLDDELFGQLLGLYW